MTASSSSSRSRSRLSLQPHLLDIVKPEYPRFSDAEYNRRHQLLEAMMERHDCDYLLVITDHRAGNAVQWATAWPGTNEAYLIFKRNEPLTMYVEWFNHVPLATKIARGIQVQWGEHRGIEKTIEVLKARGARRVGLIGPLVPGKYLRLAQQFEMISLEADYVRARMIKSEEEIDWLKIGAAFSDAGVQALFDQIQVGMDERELGALVDSAYLSHGGTSMIRYIGVTDMQAPHLYVPPQYPSSRKVKNTDVVFCEISAFWWDYAGQVLRTFYVQQEPTALYQKLQATAQSVFEAILQQVRHGATMQSLLQASALIEAEGFTTCDDLIHGFGGGYFQPILGSHSRPAGPIPSLCLEENMTIVVQPNVTTREEAIKGCGSRAGVQVGELIRVTRTGFERLHQLPLQLGVARR